MKNAKDPKIEEAIIAREMEKWASSLARLSGFLAPDQDVANHFAIELARGKQGNPTYTLSRPAICRRNRGCLKTRPSPGLKTNGKDACYPQTT